MTGATSRHCWSTAFSEFPAQTIVTAGETVGSVPVVGSKTQRVSLVTGAELSYPVAEGETVETILHAPEFVYAPVLPGQAGQLEILVDGARVSQVPVYYAQTAEETAPARGFWKRIFGG